MFVVLKPCLWFSKHFCGAETMVLQPWCCNHIMHLSSLSPSLLKTAFEQKCVSASSERVVKFGLDHYVIRGFVSKKLGKHTSRLATTV